MEAEDIQKTRNLALKADQAILDLTEGMRGAVHYGSIGSQIDFLEQLNVIEPRSEYDAFKHSLKTSESFKDSYLFKHGEDRNTVIRAHLFSSWHGIEMDVAASPDKSYGVRLEVRWRSDGGRNRADSKFENSIWDWEDENAISRLVVGYAITTCSNRGCFERWKFLPAEKQGDSK